MENLNAPFLGAFLHDLENHRANGARSRNLRLTAIRSFFRYAALETPQHSALIQRVLAIPNKRQPRPLVDFLTRPEIRALLAVPNRNTRLGRRDHALLLTAVQTGYGFPKSQPFDRATSRFARVRTSVVKEKGGRSDAHPWLSRR